MREIDTRRILALALLLPLILGEFDLSIGSNPGLAAMVVALLSANEHWPILLACLVAIAASTVVGIVNAAFAVGFGTNTIIVTLAAGTIVEGVTYWISGANTISGVAPSLSDWTFLKTFLGIPIEQHVWIAFSLSAFFTSVAGAMYALLNNFADPHDLRWDQSGDFVIMAVLGGMRSFWGPLIGAAIYVVLQDYLSSQTENWMSFIGLFFVLVVLFFPRGVLGRKGLRYRFPAALSQLTSNRVMVSLGGAVNPQQRKQAKIPGSQLTQQGGTYANASPSQVSARNLQRRCQGRKRGKENSEHP